MELDLSKINEIDMECDVPDDDDTFITVTPTKSTISASDSVEDDFIDDRPLHTKTGIIISFEDEDVSPKPEAISFDTWDDDPYVAKGSNQGSPFVTDPASAIGYNPIDMECKYADVDDDFCEDTHTLVDEERMNEDKKASDTLINQGKVEDDFYDKLQKKHQATNKKGAYNTHFHFAGNPKAEMDDFNAMMTPAGPVPNMVTVTAQAASDAAVAESRSHPSYKALFEDLLKITGFELTDCGNGQCKIRDLYSSDNEQVCDTITAVELFLTPYVEDCFIIPLQVETGENFKTCKEWVDWYTPAMQSKYPQCANDIKYCDTFGNHLPECKLF